MIKVVLNDVIKIISGGTPKTSVEEYWNNGKIGWLSINDFNNDYRKVYNSEKKITELGLKESSTKLLEIDDIIISARGTVGVLAQIGHPMAFNQSCFGIRGKEDLIDNTYLYYALKNYIVNIKKRSQGSVFDTINLDSFKVMEIDIYSSISTQQKIAAVLSALDDKIELNNKINQALEQMAKTLYDYWFVQFDFPFDFAQGKPNENGKPYKSSGGKMVYNEVLKREIPDGWEVKSLSKIESNIITGKTPSTLNEKNFNGDIPFITIDDIRQQLFIFNSQRSLSRIGANTQASKYLEKGDIAISCIGTVGVIGIIGIESQTNQQINSISKIKDYNRYFLLNALKMYFEFNIAAKQGAVLANMNKGEFSEIPILDSLIEIKKEYLKKVSPLYLKIENNLKQNQELAQLRDWLLPMLMNGQVKVGDVEEDILGMVTEPEVAYHKTVPNQGYKEDRFQFWLSNQKLAARGDVDEVVLREIFDAIDDEDQ
ncbi:EcoKI restriction-modification system protein HsdS [Algoriella xinjiangensis]|uniref:restriction endonuclease subunit S n=1 Tax=Algoriella xinjiangensis TaxID=684065 RepID=UPI000F631B32|nr:restriction endonuclease subunit S [Algoriella xinjiangensis]VDH17595.1 EcoKI restriction-modification system protein HsdS [Algoriella xinjiangensis]